MFLETSTKLDILLLGSFTNMSITGVYGLISVFSDIIIQYNVLIRSYFNPEITAVFYTRSIYKFKLFFRSILKMSYLANIGFVILLSLVLVFFVYKVPSLEAYIVGVNSLLILAFFYILTGGFFICFQIFGQIGLPLTQSYASLLLFLSNLILNLILIPSFEIIGAALATGMSLSLIHI